MINNMINALEDTVDAHSSMMMYAHSIGLQGLKRFNRYETIENLKRVNELKNYMLEFKLGTYGRTKVMAMPAINSYSELIDATIAHRAQIITMIEDEYNESKDLVYCDMLNCMDKDFKKELEVFTRIKEKLSYISNEDMTKLYLFEWDKEMHEYIKKKED